MSPGVLQPEIALLHAFEFFKGTMLSNNLKKLKSNKPKSGWIIMLQEFLTVVAIVQDVS